MQSCGPPGIEFETNGLEQGSATYGRPANSGTQRYKSLAREL